MLVRNHYHITKKVKINKKYDNKIAFSICPFIMDQPTNDATNGFSITLMSKLAYSHLE